MEDHVLCGCLATAVILSIESKAYAINDHLQLNSYLVSPRWMLDGFNPTDNVTAQELRLWSPLTDVQRAHISMEEQQK